MVYTTLMGMVQLANGDENEMDEVTITEKNGMKMIHDDRVKATEAVLNTWSGRRQLLVGLLR